MNLRTSLVALLAVVSGIGAVWLVNVALAARQTGPSTDGTVGVLVAAANVPRGAMIVPELLEKQSFPKDLVPPGAMTSEDAALDRAVLNPLVKGELLLDTKLAAKGSGRGLAAVVPPGMRAITIQTSN